MPLAASGDSGTNTIAHPVQFYNLSASNGTATTVGIRLTSGFTSLFNSTAAASASVVSLQNDLVFPSLGSLATLTIQGLDPAKKYGLFFIGAASFSTAFTINSVSKIASGNTYDGAWTGGGEFVSFAGIAPPQAARFPSASATARHRLIAPACSRVCKS